MAELRTVWLETSNVLIGRDGHFAGFCSGGEQRDGGHLVTAGAQHWIVTVGDWMYQAGDTDGMNVADRDDASASQAGRRKVGVTEKTDDEIWDFVCDWNDEEGGSRPYNLLTNSCQTFAVHLARFLCNGEGRLPTAGGAQLAAGEDHFVAAVGVGEVVSASFDGMKAALSAPSLAVQGIKGKGAFIKAEFGKAEVAAETSLGRVGLHWGLNANTGAGVRDGNAEASWLGFGVKAGKDGIGVQTPLFGADCCIM